MSPTTWYRKELKKWLWRLIRFRQQHATEMFQVFISLIQNLPWRSWIMMPDYWWVMEPPKWVFTHWYLQMLSVREAITTLVIKFEQRLWTISALNLIMIHRITHECCTCCTWSQTWVSVIGISISVKSCYRQQTTRLNGQGLACDDIEQWRIQDFPDGGSNLWVWGKNLLFAENCMKMKDIWPYHPPWIRQWRIMIGEMATL